MKMGGAQWPRKAGREKDRDSGTGHGEAVAQRNGRVAQEEEEEEGMNE